MRPPNRYKTASDWLDVRIRPRVSYDRMENCYTLGNHAWLGLSYGSLVVRVCRPDGPNVIPVALIKNSMS